MKVDCKRVYDFHFIMDADMKMELKGLDMYKESGSLSSMIVNIFTMLAQGLENKYFYGEQMESCYEYVTDNPETAREHIHVYMPHYLYRQLKLLHQDLNFFSIAQIVRGFLRFFLDVVEEFGDDYQKELSNLLSQWENENKKNQISPSSLAQLLLFIRTKTPMIKLISIYSPIYKTIKKYRL